MGYLHEGHLSLVRRAARENDAVAVSIFVNPLQFGPREDFASYPRDLKKDAALLKKERVDFLFVPVSGEFYPEDFQTEVSVKRLSGPLCGASRPTHFAGVATVVLKLLNLVRPDTVYLGLKDYQQVRVLEQMVKDLDLPVRVRRMPTVREPDGLAMSSRNARLTPEERRQAPLLYQALRRGARLVRSGLRDPRKLKEAMQNVLRAVTTGRLDYLEIRDARTLGDVVELKKRSTALLALAVHFSKTRLIDNLQVKV